MKYPIAFLLVCGWLFSQCGAADISGKKELKILNIALLPTDNSENMKNRYLPLIRHLSEKLKIPYTLMIPKSYEHHLELFRDKKINLALFEGYTFVKANKDFMARALVLRDIDLSYSSLFLVRKESKAKTLQDLKGKKLAFGSRLSTSGHLMPRYFLLKQKIIPEDFFAEISYSGSPDKSLELLYEGKVEVVSVDFIRAQKAILGSQNRKAFARQLTQTHVYSDYVWAMQREYSEEWVTRVRDTFMELSMENLHEARILEGLNAKYYLPAGENDFSYIRELLHLTGKN